MTADGGKNFSKDKYNAMHGKLLLSTFLHYFFFNSLQKQLVFVSLFLRLLMQKHKLDVIIFLLLFYEHVSAYSFRG